MEHRMYLLRTRSVFCVDHESREKRLRRKLLYNYLSQNTGRLRYIYVPLMIRIYAKILTLYVTRFFMEFLKLAEWGGIFIGKKQCTVRYVFIYKKPDILRYIFIRKKQCTSIYVFISKIYRIVLIVNPGIPTTVKPPVSGVTITVKPPLNRNS